MGLTEPILSRFDILCVVRDHVDPAEDDLLSDFVIGNHRRMHPEQQRQQAGADEPALPSRDAITGVEFIPQALLRKYIAYARDTVHPKLQISEDRVMKLYADLREQSQLTGSVVVTLRSAESMIRMAEAHAKLHLRQYVTDEDVKVVTRIMLECFINTQKASVMKQMRRVSGIPIDNASAEIRAAAQLQARRQRHPHVLPEAAGAQAAVLRAVAQRSRCPGAGRGGRAGREGELLECSRPTLWSLQAKEMQLGSLQSFYNSRIFQNNHFQYDANMKRITQVF